MRPDFPTLSPLDAIKALCRANAPRVLDLRLPEDRALHPGAVLGATTVAFDDIEAQMALAEHRGAITLCHKGLKLSAGAAARLVARGCTAWRMAGGQVGWLHHELPVTLAPAPTLLVLPWDATATEATAAWAVKRFVAPEADLLEVPREDLVGVADKFAAQIAASADIPPLPGLEDVAQSAIAPSSLCADQLHGAGTRPSAAFTCLDAAYRGRLDQIAHGPTTALDATSRGEGKQP